LLVADKWGTGTVPGEVIACPPAGRRTWFQIAAGPERVGDDAMVCTYFSLRGADGADVCTDLEPQVNPLMAIQADGSDRVELAGIAPADMAIAAGAGRLTLIPIARGRAARLGARRAFAYFSLRVDRHALCAGDVRLAGRRVPHTRSLGGALCERPAALARLTEALAGLREVFRL
jgi:hypothetical protein